MAKMVYRAAPAARQRDLMPVVERDLTIASGVPEPNRFVPRGPAPARPARYSLHFTRAAEYGPTPLLDGRHVVITGGVVFPRGRLTPEAQPRRPRYRAPAPFAGWAGGPVGAPTCPPKA